MAVVQHRAAEFQGPTIEQTHRLEECQRERMLSRRQRKIAEQAEIRRGGDHEAVQPSERESERLGGSGDGEDEGGSEVTSRSTTLVPWMERRNYLDL